MKNPDPPFSYPTLEESRNFLRESSPEDFDGHTSFSNMTLEQRIQWASLSALVVYRARREQKKKHTSVVRLTDS